METEIFSRFMESGTVLGDWNVTCIIPVNKRRDIPSVLGKICGRALISTLAENKKEKVAEEQKDLQEVDVVRVSGICIESFG